MSQPGQKTNSMTAYGLRMKTINSKKIFLRIGSARFHVVLMRCRKTRKRFKAAMLDMYMAFCSRKHVACHVTIDMVVVAASSTWYCARA